MPRETKPKQSFNQKVYKIVSLIPKGKVLSYGRVAALAGNYRASRAAGYAVAARNAPPLPYHRVVFKDGSLSKAFMSRGKNKQYALLRAEKVKFDKEKKVKMRLCQWRADTLELRLFLEEGL